MNFHFGCGIVMAGVFALLTGTGSLREHAVVEPTDSLSALESRAASDPSDTAIQELAENYLRSQAPGAAVGVLERRERRSPKLEHLYARALVEEGRAQEALSAEQRVLDRCATEPQACELGLIASAMHRAGVFRELVALGIEDAQAHPEASALAYSRATRQVTLAVR